MAKIFLCYASDDKPNAEAVQLALASAGHTVFFDEQSLPPGGDYQRRIQEAIRACDVFVFLASPTSLSAGRFTLTELDFARQRWPSPVDRVLPVLLHGVQLADLPAYLRAATVLQVKGNAAAEVRAAVAPMVARNSRGIRVAGYAVLCCVGLALVFFVWNRRNGGEESGPSPASQLWTPMRGTIQLHSDSGDFIGDGKSYALSDSTGVIKAQVTDSTIAITFEGDEQWSLDFATPRGQSWKRQSYLNAQRTPFNNPLKPGMSVSGAGRGCNELVGEFVIHALEVANENKPMMLEVTFNQVCDSSKAPLRGEIVLRAGSQ